MDVFCWRNIGNKFVQLSILLVIITACVFGAYDNTKIDTPLKFESIIQNEDPISPIIVYYTMLKSSGKDAKFESRDGVLHLISEDGIYSVNVEKQMDGDICDPYQLYQNSKLYSNIPYRPEMIADIFIDRLRDKDLFILYLDKSIQSEQCNKYINRLVNLVDNGDIDETKVRFDILRMIAKAKIMNLVNTIFDEYPCIE